MNERTLLSEMMWSLRQEKNSFVYKIPDMPLGPGSNLRFNIKKPFDLFYVKNGLFNAIEAKYITNKAFPFAALKEHQERGLQNALNAGANSYVLIFINLSVKERFAILIHYKTYKLIKEDLEFERKSIPLDLLEAHGTTIKRKRNKELKRYYFDLNKFI